MIDEQGWRDFYNAAGGNYPPVAPAAAPAASPARAPGAPEVQPAQRVPEGPDAATADRAEWYAPVLTKGVVDWAEPAAQPADFDLQSTAPYAVDQSDAGQAAMTRLREGLAEAGAGVSLGRELFNDAILAHQQGPVTTRERGEAELRQHFGARYDAQVAAARGLVQRAAVKAPEIIEFLERTGLGNDPTFIRKLAARAARARS